jgi:hypothetical protein
VNETSFGNQIAQPPSEMRANSQAKLKAKKTEQPTASDRQRVGPDCYICR